MTRGAVKNAKSAIEGHGQFTYPVAPVSDWVQICDNLATADNGGTNPVINPDALDGTHHHDFRPSGKGTTLLACVKYDDGHAASPTSPVIQFFGKDQNGKWHKLKDAGGNHALTLTCVGATAATDLTDGTDLYSDPVEVDIDGSVIVRAGIKIAFNGGGDDSLSRLLVKTK